MGNNAETELMKKEFYFDFVTKRWKEGAAPSWAPKDRMQQMLPDIDSILILPDRWMVRRLDNGIVELMLHVYMGRIVQDEIRFLEDKNWSIECSFSSAEMNAWPIALLKERKDPWIDSCCCHYSAVFPEMLGASRAEIPAVVTDAAIEFLQDQAIEEFGFRPSYLGSVRGLRHLTAFCKRPLDPHVWMLRNVIGENFEKMFPRTQRDSYRPLCKLLGIDHPPKSLRKAYAACPENIVAYVLMRQLGFRDINIIRRFFYRENLFGYPLLKLRCHPERHCMEDLSRLQMNPYLTWLERFCHWFLRHRTEKQLARQILPLAIDGGWDMNASDSLRMFVYGNVDEDNPRRCPLGRQMLLREGFTGETHDMLMHELNDIVPQHGHRRGKIKNTQIKYTEEEKELESRLNGVQFCLPKETDDLLKYGRRFHNCVGSYRMAVLEKRSVIVAMMKETKYIACIEVRQHHVAQALGPCNRDLSFEEREIVSQWAKNNKLLYA